MSVTHDPLMEYLDFTRDTDAGDRAEEMEGPDDALVVVRLGDGNTAALVCLNETTGEVVGVEDAPLAAIADQATAEHVIAWLGPRRAAAQARLAGLEAEKTAWIERINAVYDGRIRRERSLLGWYATRYHDLLRYYADVMLTGQKGRTVVAGLLRLSFRRKPRKIEVADSETAVVWAQSNCPDAVKVTTSVLPSKIPDDLWETIHAATEGASGLRLVPPSDVFKVE